MRRGLLWVAGLAGVVSVPGLMLIGARDRAPTPADDPETTIDGDTTAAPPSAAPARSSYSNIHAGDYVGPEVCGQCHEDRYAQWRAHPHSRMNQDADEHTVLGDFSGVSARYGGVRAVFERRDGAFVMSMYRARALVRRYRVTRTIGSRLQQAYIGVQTHGPEPADDPLYTIERALPWVYWFSRKAWYPEHYVEEYPQPEHDATGNLTYPVDDPHAAGARPWNDGCLWCHNTYPYELRFARDFPGRGFSHVELATNRAPPEHGPTPDDLVTLGVSCESCHFGGREHAEEGHDIRFAPTSPHLARWEPQLGGSKTRSNPEVVNAICSQCHVAVGMPYPNGASQGNSAEASDLMAGACTPAISCTDCHDPHVAGPPGGRPDDPTMIAACTECHDAYTDELARSQHARHRADDASCLDCHMPRITQGIDTVVRSHRIGSPTNPAMLASAAPNACNLCHLDRSIAWTLDQLETGWGVEVAPDPSWYAGYGEQRERPVGEVWLDHPTPIDRLVAADAYGRTPLGASALSTVLDILADPYPNNRMFGLFAVERIIGRRLRASEWTPTAHRDVRERQLDDLRRTLPTRRPR